jgi:hypothetical protein
MKPSFFYFPVMLLLVCSCGASKYLTAETTATCVDHHYNIGNNSTVSRWTYHVGGKTYTEPDRDIFGEIVGQAAYIKYYPQDPTAFVVIRSKPVFYTDEHTGTTDAEVLKVSKRKVKFVYHINKDTYTYSQFTDTKITEFKKGDTIRIEYWKKNPQRSIILFKNPTYDIHVKRSY